MPYRSIGRGQRTLRYLTLCLIVQKFSGERRVAIVDTVCNVTVEVITISFAEKRIVECLIDVGL